MDNEDDETKHTQCSEGNFMKYELDLIWKKITDILQQEVSADTFDRWFKTVQLEDADGSQVTLRVTKNICKVWLETNYMGLLQSVIQEVLGGSRTIRFSIVESPEYKEEAIPQTGMNPENTFDSFVVGANNQFAHAAALTVAQNPGKIYNPLFVYSGLGMGKTHLMHAIGQHAIATKKELKVIYLNSEKFTSEFIDAIQNSKLVKFRNKYRKADVLLIDDIQFFAGKERSQEEFFHTFNTLFDARKQIVISSDRAPIEILNLEGRLASRFEWGLLAELQPPDMETRMAILRKKEEVMKVEFDDSILEFLAQHIQSNVRRLEGALMRVAAFSSLSGRELTPEAVENLLKDILMDEAKRRVSVSKALGEFKGKPRITFDEQ